MRLPNTLTDRLTIIFSTWLLIMILGLGILLTNLYVSDLERDMIRYLDQLNQKLIKALISDDYSKPNLLSISLPIRFEQPDSGWYWQVHFQGEIIYQSPSLIKNNLSTDGGRAIPPLATMHLNDHNGLALLARFQKMEIPGTEALITVMATGPYTEINSSVRTFIKKLIILFVILSVGLVAMIKISIDFGLRPLKKLKRLITNGHQGQMHRLPDDLPKEIQPIILELNSLLDYQENRLQQSRLFTENLAHALKNSLAVIKNECFKAPKRHRQLVWDQINRMTRYINSHVTLAGVAGIANLSTTLTPIKKTAEALCPMFEQLYQNRAIKIKQQHLEDLGFLGDEQDLEEIMGNLIDNACKWANQRVIVSGKRSNNRIGIAIDDDGPGIPPDSYNEILERGLRLDENIPGEGIGLAIVHYIVQLYKGKMSFKKSRLGGLRVEVYLPAANVI